MNLMFWMTLGLFSLTYVGLAVGRVPGLRMDRAGIALVGATAMLVLGLLSFHQAVSPECINYEALTLLFGMMVVVGVHVEQRGCARARQRAQRVECASLGHVRHAFDHGASKLPRGGAPSALPPLHPHGTHPR